MTNKEKEVQIALGTLTKWLVNIDCFLGFIVEAADEEEASSLAWKDFHKMTKEDFFNAAQENDIEEYDD